jgi:hypothetical protein
MFYLFLFYFIKNNWAQFCGVAKSGNRPWENFVKFGYKLNMKEKTFKGLLLFWLST